MDKLEDNAMIARYWKNYELAEFTNKFYYVTRFRQESYTIYDSMSDK